MRSRGHDRGNAAAIGLLNCSKEHNALLAERCPAAQPQ
jgi:hypothetical protein